MPKGAIAFSKSFSMMLCPIAYVVCVQIEWYAELEASIAHLHAQHSQQYNHDTQATYRARKTLVAN